jgi:hypothetical protein
MMAAAGIGAEFEDVPVAGVLLGPVAGALAGSAEFFLAWGGAVGFGFAVGHGNCVNYFRASLAECYSSSLENVQE